MMNIRQNICPLRIVSSVAVNGVNSNHGVTFHPYATVRRPETVVREIAAFAISVHQLLVTE